MRLIIQRVNRAEVSVSGKVSGKIGKGLFVLFGVGESDFEADAKVLAEKVSKLRIMSDDNDKMNLSVSDTNSSILVVSQFTLYADTKDGNRPSFIKAKNPQEARTLYELFLELLEQKGIDVQKGVFGEYMKISLELDGPVTILLDSSDYK
ncbi:MAG: D-tyrosyl-tRNA(Tyr) deacylase [Candidatus Woesebacteria bacterium GW2011_GWA1_39_21]|uniref:D-aminoacyl-tRNA deacylase n=1 Tax=Candidatus Woesebacteria bacterium GW2011_GWA1_39_21 TaxID=1618550 RepID=A0A0G0N6H2_9BACT|nr:MAG: D-tyrosyl-tRNA(Tyr) deacylase [Candidatus Woesebacteria bacterium GW2011_GWA1_39_21]